MNRTEILDKANQIISVDRENEYGSVEDNFNVISELWSAYLNTAVSAHDVGIMMALLKIARIKTGASKADNYIDAIGYLALASELQDVT